MPASAAALPAAKSVGARAAGAGAAAPECTSTPPGTEEGRNVLLSREARGALRGWSAAGAAPPLVSPPVPPPPAAGAEAAPSAAGAGADASAAWRAARAAALAAPALAFEAALVAALATLALPPKAPASCLELPPPLPPCIYTGSKRIIGPLRVNCCSKSSPDQVQPARGWLEGGVKRGAVRE